MGSGPDTPVLTFANGLAGDPAVHCHYPTSGRCFMFDLGAVEAFSHRSLLKARHFFISHTHIDHFTGFDRVLRINIPHRRELTFVGPPGLAANIHGKMRGYTWNLLDPGQIAFHAVEVGADGACRAFKILSDEGFVPREVPHGETEPGRVVSYADGAFVQGVVLDHGIPSVAYRYVAPARYAVDNEALAREGLTAGPWIQEMQRHLAQNQDADVDVGGATRRAFALRDAVTHVKPERSLAYVTDAGFDQGNVARLVAAFGVAQELICEASFRDADAARALSKKHLTTRQAAMLGRALRAKSLHPFHFSQIYQDGTEGHAAEAQDFFAAYRDMDDAAFVAAMAAEWGRHA